jgi:perosamine synthetase
MIFCGQPDIGSQEQANVLAVLKSGRLTRGPWCRLFEERLQEKLRQPAHVVSSGTAALHLALAGVGVGKGDEVIVPATTFVATANAVLYCRAKPVVVDIDERTWNIWPGGVKLAITPKTRAIVPVHLYGLPAEMDELRSIVADRFRATGQRIAIVEDCAEAFGATGVGHGDAAAYSFFGSKTITTGEGGAVTWSNPLVGERVFHLAGQSMTDVWTRYHHDCLGYNYRMTELQAAVGVAQLGRIEEFLEKRRQIFRWYDARLPRTYRRQRQEDSHGCWAFAVTRDGIHPPVLIRRLREAGVESRPIFFPLDRLPHIGGKPTPVAHRLHQTGIVLPTHTGLTEGDIDTICLALEKAASCS